MVTYGIDAGTANNALVSLGGSELRRLEFETRLRPPPEDDWRSQARELAAELAAQRIYPLGVDAALSLARPPDLSRPWETWMNGFKTPSSVPSRPDGGSEQQLHWWRLARWWTAVAHTLAKEHEYEIWTGGEVSAGARLLVEVYPRVSWVGLAAGTSHAIDSIYKSGTVAWRDEVIAALDLHWNTRKKGTHDRDAAICAVTVRQVLRGKARFFGQKVSDAGSHWIGGGIAIPWT